MAPSCNRLALVAVVFVCAIGQLSRADDTEELVKETISMPDSCERKSKQHDMLSMHYTGTLTADGKKFDSR